MRIFLIVLIALFSVSAYAEPTIEELVPYIIQIESGGDALAISKAGAIGLMQITPIVLTEYKNCHKNDDFIQAMRRDSLFHRQINIDIGTWYLNRLKDHYLKDHYTIPRMLAAYNGGITRLRKAKYNIDKMPKETRSYVYKVIRHYNTGHPLDPIKYKDLGGYSK